MYLENYLAMGMLPTPTAGNVQQNTQFKQGGTCLQAKLAKNATNSNSTNNKTRTLGQVLGKPNRKKANGYSYVECPNQWENFPTESPVCGRNDGLSSELDGITFPKWRNESIKAYGNAIVPQVAFQIFKALEKSLYLYPAERKVVAKYFLDLLETEYM
jgi:hypothetical protein